METIPTVYVDRNGEKVLVNQSEMREDDVLWKEKLPDPEKPAELSDEEKIGLIKDQIDEMLTADPEKTAEGYWTKAGTPNTNEIERRLKEKGHDFNVSADMRDLAWEDFKD